MKLKKCIALLLALALTAALAGCSDDTAVYVQSVKQLAGMGGIAPGDKFLGLVVSENVAEIKKDKDKAILELKVHEGDDVKKGQELFSYDTEELQLSLDKQRLELEQLNASIENYKSQIAQLEKTQKSANATLKLQYTVEIQSLQVDLKEAELNIVTKQNEIKKSEDLLENAVITAPVDGRVQAINEAGTDQNGNEVPYITIQQVGSYRIKGVLGELQRGSLMANDRVKITARTDDSQVWGGTVTLVDYENPTQNDDNNRVYVMGSDEMTTSSKYPFYVKLDSTEGLLLGQHVYMELETEGSESSALSISLAFIAYEEDGTPFVWAENRNKLEKRPVTLGQTNDMQGTVEILEGLTPEDYIAFPDAELCRPGVPTTHNPEAAAQSSGGEMDAGGEMGMVDGDMGMADGDMGMADGGMDMADGDMGMGDGGMDMAGSSDSGMTPETEEAPAETGTDEASAPEETGEQQPDEGSQTPTRPPVAPVG